MKFPRRLGTALQRLEARDAPSVARAVAVLWIAELLVRGPGLRAACRWLGIRDPSAAPLVESPVIPEGTAHRYERSAARALRWSGLPNTCLRRALVGGYLTRSFRPTLRLGVRQRMPFEAHAWLEYAGVAFDGLTSKLSTGGLRRSE